MNNYQSRISGKKFVIGFVFPVLVALFFYLIDYSFGLQVFAPEKVFGFIYQLPLIENIQAYSSHPYAYIFMFGMCVLLMPINVIYWWQIVPSGFEQRVRTMGFNQGAIIFLGGFVMCAVFFVIWFIDDKGLSARRQAQFIYVFKSPVLFYLFILMSISLAALFCAASLKFAYIKTRNLIKNNRG